MKAGWTAGVAVVGLVLAAFGSAWAEAKVTVTREENKAAKVSIKAGEEVRWVNATGGTAHISFGTNAVQFYLGRGDDRVKFTENGTYAYTVHMSGVKAHAHTGTVEVK